MLASLRFDTSARESQGGFSGRGPSRTHEPENALRYSRRRLKVAGAASSTMQARTRSRRVARPHASRNLMENLVTCSSWSLGSPRGHALSPPPRERVSECILPGVGKPPADTTNLCQDATPWEFGASSAPVVSSPQRLGKAVVAMVLRAVTSRLPGTK